jgi:hypothetical protein
MPFRGPYHLQTGVMVAASLIACIDLGTANSEVAYLTDKGPQLISNAP